jgi:hypothetical protein
VYTYIYSDGSWRLHSYIKAPVPDEDDWFGQALALSRDGQTLAIGAQGESSSATAIGGNQGDNSADRSGAVYIY